jgi:ATP/maltotriose-dependent transcriptional regulator MalT
MTSAEDTTTDGAAAADAALDALLRRDWARASDLYHAQVTTEPTAAAWEGYATARWWLDDVDAAIDARERAYAERRARGQTVEASYDAAFLAWDHGAMRGASAVANGWLQRARSLVAELPPSGEQAWLSLIEASFHIDTDASVVLRLSTEAEQLAHEHGALDVEMTAKTLRGLALVTLGEVEQGTHLLDEGAAAATGGELHDPIAVGSCCCNMIIACERIRDFERLAQWCGRLEALAERSGQRPLLALCRAHHGTAMTARGEWTTADAELGWAASELATLRPPLAGYARVRLAELRRRQGRPVEAGALLAEADDHVLAPLGHAALALDDADLTGALAHAERHLRRIGGDLQVDGAAAWELLVTIHLGRDEASEARAAHERLADISAAVGTGSLAAAERQAAGRLALGDGDADGARRAFEDAIDLYRGSVAPFEVATTRLALARVLEAADRREAARDLARQATDGFEQLGAARASRQAGEVARHLGAPRRASGLTARESEVLGLLAAGLSNREIADDLVLSEHTVHRHVANVFTKLGVSSRAAAVARAAQDQLLP